MLLLWVTVLVVTYIPKEVISLSKKQKFVLGILDIELFYSLSKDHSTQINIQYIFDNFMEAS